MSVYPEEIEDEKDVKELVTELSLKYQLMSKHTSIVAVDTKENKSSLAMQSRNIPNQVPHGFHGHGGGAFRSMARYSSDEEDEDNDMGMGLFDSPKRCSSDLILYSDIEMICDTEMLEEATFSVQADAPSSVEVEPKSSVDEKALSSIDKVISLISLQTTEGSFPKNGKIIKVLGLDESEVDKLATDTDDKVVYTLLVLTALKQRFKEFESSWELVGSKAEQYLKKHNPPSDLNQKIINLLNEK